MIHHPDFHCLGGSGKILDFLENYIGPHFSKLNPGAHILLRVVNTDDVNDYVLHFGKMDMPLKATLMQRYEEGGESWPRWLLFQKPGPEKLPKIDPKKSFHDVLPFSSRTVLENKIYSDSVYRYSESQNVLRHLVKMICPKPQDSNILVPYFGLGEAIAACEALKINSVGFDDYLEDPDHQYSRKVIEALINDPSDS